jgi:hypothetical protein
MLDDNDYSYFTIFQKYKKIIAEAIEIYLEKYRIDGNSKRIDKKILE